MPGKALARKSLAATARWAAAVRAMESAREDPLFSDPWAAALAGSEGAAWIQRRSPDSVIPMVLRTRFFDDFLLRIAREHAIRQVVLMAAGLDTRAFRLGWPARTRLFELDQPDVLSHKERVLQTAGARPTCKRTVVACNLTGSWVQALTAACFNPQQPSAWLLEGFLFYLTSQDLTKLLDRTLGLAAPGSWIGFDIINSITLSSPLTQQWVEMQAKAGAPWIGSLDDPGEFIAARGWKATLVQLGSPEANYNRWPYPVVPSAMPGMPRMWFVLAQKGSQQPAECLPSGRMVDTVILPGVRVAGLAWLRYGHLSVGLAPTRAPLGSVRADRARRSIERKECSHGTEIGISAYHHSRGFRPGPGCCLGAALRPYAARERLHRPDRWRGSWCRGWHDLGVAEQVTTILP
jgi:methyltransferase (TIGR00027 family)